MNSCERELVSMKACVKQVCPCHLVVCDLCNNQEVLVHTDKACCFRVGDCVCIEYNGAMTMSLPPHITAEEICCATGC